MKHTSTLLFRPWMLLAGVLLALPAVAQESDEAPAEEAAEEPVDEEAPAEDAEAMSHGGRMEFDARLVRGETAAGSVVLFQRRPRNLPGLVPMRRSFRTAIVEPVLGPEALVPAESDEPEEETE